MAMSQRARAEREWRTPGADPTKPCVLALRQVVYGRIIGQSSDMRTAKEDMRCNRSKGSLSPSWKQKNAWQVFRRLRRLRETVRVDRQICLPMKSNRRPSSSLSRASAVEPAREVMMERATVRLASTK